MKCDDDSLSLARSSARKGWQTSRSSSQPPGSRCSQQRDRSVGQSWMPDVSMRPWMKSNFCEKSQSLSASAFRNVTFGGAVQSGGVRSVAVMWVVGRSLAMSRAHAPVPQPMSRIELMWLGRGAVWSWSWRVRSQTWCWRSGYMSEVVAGGAGRLA